MRILQLVPWEPGGKPTSMSRYAQRMAALYPPSWFSGRVAGTYFNIPAALRRRIPGQRSYERLPRRLLGGFDLVHCTDGWQAVHRRRFPGVPFVVTVHDTIPLEGYSGREWPGTWMYRRALREAARSTLVITPSVAVREALSRRAGFDPDRLRVVPVPLPWEFVPGAGAMERPGWLPPGKAVLSVGTISAYKNLPLLIEAMGRPELRHARLIRIGQRFDQNLWNLARRAGVADRVIELGNADEAMLLDAYRHCDALAQPSFNEGFGMPVAEALGCGLPVVLSDGGALPEVAGDAGVVVPLRRRTAGPRDARDVEAFAGALATVLEDASARARTATLGPQAVARFRPAAVWETLLGAYRDAERLGPCC